MTKSITSALAALMLAASLTVAAPVFVTSASADCSASECPPPEPCLTAEGEPCPPPPVDPCSAEGAAIVEASQAQQQLQRQRATIKRLRAKLAARR